MSLLEPSKVYRPFKYPWLNDAAKLHEKIHWIEDEITNLQDDLRDYKKLDDYSRFVINQILKLFTQSDVAVGQWYIDRLMPVIQNNEARCWLLSAGAREGIHQRAYALLNDTLGIDESAYSAFLEYAGMKAKFEFMFSDNHGATKEQKLALDLAQLVFMEGVMLFGAFSTLINFERQEAGGVMRGMAKVVEWSIRDESMHVETNAKLFRAACEDHPRIVTDGFKKKIYDMAREVVRLENIFLDEVFAGGDLPALKKDDVKQYIAFLADRRLLQLGLKANFGADTHNMRWLDEKLNLTTHGNFFEVPVSEYGVSGMMGDWGYAG